MILIFGKGFIGNSLNNYFISKNKKTTIISTSKENFKCPKFFPKLNSKLNNKNVILIISSFYTRLRGNSLNTLRGNLEFSEIFLKLIHQKYIKKIIFLSSIDVYQNSNNIINEESLIECNDNYSLLKLHVEKLLTFQCKILKKKFFILRMPGVYGYEDKFTSTIGKLIKDAKNEKVIKLSNNGETIRDFISITDVCNVVEIIIRKKNPFLLINLVTGRNLNLFNYASIIKNYFYCKIILEKKKTSRDYNTIFSNKKIIDNLNYKFCSLDDEILNYKNRVLNI